MVKRDGQKRWRSAAARLIVEFSGTTGPEAAVGVIANDLVKDFLHPPTDLNAIAEKLDVKEILPDDIPFSGELRREQSGLILRYGTHLNRGRMRFTIAHELGHAVFSRAGLRLPHRGPEVERLCDLFAGELLMPSVSFLRFAKPISVSRVFDLARQFDVSLAAAAVRCASLLDVSLFQTNADRIQWGYGKYRGGSLSALHPKLRFLEGRAGSSGEDLVLMDAVLWRVEWCRRDNDESLLVLLSPNSKGPGRTAARLSQ